MVTLNNPTLVNPTFAPSASRSSLSIVQFFKIEMLTFYLASVDLRYLIYQDKLKRHHRMNMSVSPIHPFIHTHASRKPATCPLRDSSPPPVPFQLIVGCTLVCLLLDSMKSGFSLYMSSCSSFFSAGDGVEEFERLSEVCEGYECLRTACSVAHR